MSSTSRGGKRSPADFYATPAWTVHRFLERVTLPGGVWYEFAAGDGAIIRAVNEKRRDIAWYASELREECRPALEATDATTMIGSFLDVRPEQLQRPKVSISNVPFSFAMEMILHSLKFSDHVVHLLRLNFLGTEERNEFFKFNMPNIYVIPDRVSFAQSVSCKNTSQVPCDWAEIYPLDAAIPSVCPYCASKVSISTTDSIEYAWFHWPPDRENRQKGSIQVLNHTPLDQRRVIRRAA